MLVEHRLPREGVIEWRVAGEQLVGDHPGRVEVGAQVDGAPRGLLRRHVGGCSYPCAAVGRDELDRVVQRLGDAEVGNLDRPVVGDEEVGRLEVAVDDARSAGTFQR